MFTHLYRQSISCILSAALLSSGLSAEGIVVDTAAAAQYRPMLESTPNAIPLINIVTPNASGLSHNKFSEFNIEQRGVIFNNATSAALTQLGGWVQGNANLGTTPARVILNEVTGTNRSLLRGYGEVAGHRADLIIANPNGITVNGGGFINTLRATLTTGMPGLDGAALNGFHVQRGDILIEGNGFNADNIDRVELYTKALQLNAQLHAKALDVVTGENTIGRDGTIISDNGVGNGYSIDSSALGGIYGSTIRLVGTDRGVGVNLPRITYASDSLELRADGQIVIGTAVASNSLTSQSGSLTVNELLYGGNNIDLSASDTIHNTHNALILSHGDIAIHDTGTLRNDAARIEASGNVVIQADHIENLSTMTPTKSSTTSLETILEYLPYSFRDWKTTATSSDSIDKTGYTPAYMLAGNDMFLDGAIHNRYSLIAAERDMYLFGSLNNEVALDAHKVIDISHYVEHWESHGHGDAWYHNYSYYEHYDTLLDHAYSTISAGRNLYGNLITVNNADVTQGTNLSSKGIAPTSYTQNISTGAITYTLPSGGNGEFVLTTDPTHPYLIESNPLFTDYNTFIGSDYIISRLHLDTAANTKRLGDARYETQLVRDAVFRLTGERRLSGFGTDTQQYQALMDNALALRGDLDLEFGVKLSASQVSALNRDIVWMEEREVAGQRVLVPVVYLASLKSTELSGGGKIIAGGDIALAVAQGVNNAGEIRAGGTLIVQADSIANTGGSIKSASDMLLHTTNDITNTSGTIRGNNVALVSDNGNIVSQTAQKSLDLSNHAGVSGNLSLVGERAGVWAQGDLVATAAKDITLKGAETSAGGDIALRGENVTLSSLEQNSHYKTTWKQGSSEIESVKQHASTLTSGGDVRIDGFKDVTVRSSNIAGENIVLNGGENVTVTAENDQEFRDIQTRSKGSFGRSKTTRDMTLKESVVSSSITGENITINSGKDTTLQAANLIASDNVQVDAGGDINLLAKEYREGELHYSKKKGFGGFSSSVSLDQSDAVKLHEATVKTEAKNIIMNSGRDINIIASEVNSAADVALKAFENLNIVAGEEVSSEKHVREKTSFNPLGVLNLVGIDAGPIYTQKINNKDNYDTTAKSFTIKAGGSITADTGTTNIIGSNVAAGGDVRVTADIGGINIASAQELHNASSLDKKTEVKIANLFNSVSEGLKGLGEDTKLKLNVASATFDESTTTAQGVTNVGSSITSGKNITIDSSDDLTIKGSDVTAKDTLTLSSTTGNIAITESIDTTNTQNKAKHASAEVNLVVQNEYVETAVAVDNAIKAAEQLKATKEDYSNYKREVKKLEASLETLKSDPQVSENDIANLQALIAATKDDEAYYIAAIAAATLNLASKSVAVAQQAEAAGASTPTAGFSAGFSLDMKESQSNTDTTSTKSNASNLTASNINIATDKMADTSVTVSGSNVNATDTLNIDTHNLNVIASKDTSSTNSSSKEISGSVSMTVYGAASGPQVSLGYGENSSRSNSTTYTNSTLTGNIVNIGATNDATFKGATVRADDTLNVNVGNNLTVASVQDTSSSSNHGFNLSGGFGMGNDSAYSSSDKTTQKTMNQSVGIRTGDGNIASVNGGIGASNGRSYDTQTLLTSLTGDSVNITTGANTKLSGAVIAATDNQGNDTGKLNLTTNTLTTENLTDTHYNSATGFSIGANIGLTPATKDPQPDTKDTETPSGTKLNSEHLAFNTSTDTSVGKTLATVGNGTLSIGDTKNSTDTTNLNRDVTKVDKELYSSSTGAKVDATIDNRLFTKTGQKEIKQQYNDMDENMKAVSETLPDANSDNKIEAIAGTIWDTAVGFTGGILPSHANSGGVLGEIPILSGDKDSVHKVLQVVNINAPLYQEEKENFIPLEQSDAYKMMSEEKQALYKDKGLYISKEPVTITKENATYQNGSNGIMNNEGLALHNVMEQTGMLNQLADSPDTAVELTISYNPTRGIVADLLESVIDNTGFGTTGIAKQTGEFIEDVTTSRGVDGSNFTLHSQANINAKRGMEYINSSEYMGDKFQNKEYFYTGKVDADGNKIYNVPTFVSFGSPVNGKDMETLIANKETGLGYTYMGAFTKPGDYVGEGLGGNSGVNTQASIIDRINLINTLRLLMGDWSPHGSYDPTIYKELKDVIGYKK